MEKTDPNLAARALLIKYGLMPESCLKNFDTQKEESARDVPIRASFEAIETFLAKIWLMLPIQLSPETKYQVLKILITPLVRQEQAQQKRSWELKRSLYRGNVFAFFPLWGMQIADFYRSLRGTPSFINGCYPGPYGAFPQSALMFAASHKGGSDLVRQLLLLKASTKNIPNRNEPILAACRSGDAASLKMLLEAGAADSETFIDQLLCVSYVIGQGHEPDLDKWQLLLDYEFPLSEDAASLLISGGCLKGVQMLFEHGYRGESGLIEHLLHHTPAQTQAEMAQLLVSQLGLKNIIDDTISLEKKYDYLAFFLTHGIDTNEVILDYALELYKRFDNNESLRCALLNQQGVRQYLQSCLGDLPITDFSVGNSNKKNATDSQELINIPPVVWGQLKQPRTQSCFDTYRRC